MSNKNVTQAAKFSAQPQDAVWLAKFIDTYQKLSTDNLQLLADVYHQDIVFIDPMHQLTGFKQLEKYFKQLYQKLSYCEFTIEHVIAHDSEAAIYWQMSYQHPRLNSGDIVTVQGSSHLKGVGDKVVYHRDYLDLGAMLYEQLPLLGRIIRSLKNRAANA
ncbi:nuclear transport factor 2 family protein [Colwellia sp. MB02u-18]|uniref:nuclear transport factor 2 family protein n=1 Tax=unclassified Colwellia TaxID=196834 RepID=UPI0015F3ED9C|nr:MULTISPECIES: nuclear transport factor 2 family protein [unclassified Colwellia]MBA6225923.1 nuclear transport factor 2 family protein [Colwellia sp. MB3u-45]MBA6267159.1 nuclear transport factor 2 family protein [Colwellia sp. MB3u-43]MBA6322083.1 nuclear transport factor 2 family protein [Colwellia sp. MB02u-19]MBA6325313.1 nuclear transport factor 2 family protein [Colwellia sp. MB02u-18]MBA6330332.1 nuclear transport factor 2 family protein [Colwellia sp. MB02u-12]